MDSQTFSLRAKPVFEVKLFNDELKIIDGSLAESISVYKYSKLEDFNFKREQTNWGITILSFIIDLFTGGGSSGKYTEKNQLLLTYSGEKMKYYLENCELFEISKIVKLVNQKIN
ncbi:hypothetical protein J0X14_10485 [Muricauda sp. CAU 1633]|uniref:hypothetical protein n=1 Tax=Allomuricauda sp. CAU 1633 TaxID=2816036 RepID=UPI001A8C123A|nr:hypothetical protein [Muricauda sp. CAU 1633]MBO0322724.1 hypothetical protein [Muricauda sp. CAU 1633]